jgi:peptide/nickel transport system permease protein
VRSFILRRLGAALIVLALSSVLIFVGVRALPGDPALALAGESRDPAALAATRAKYGLDKPLPIQYVTWLSHVVRGDMGESSKSGLPVANTIWHRLPVTLELALLSLIVALALGIPAGILAAVKPGSVWDYGGSALALIGLSVPHFWLGLMLILLVSVNLGILPASGYVPFFDDPVENLRRMVMPAFVLGTSVAAIVMRQMRSAMLDSLAADYVRTARAKGLPERAVIWQHALRNSLLTVVTVVGLQLGILISGAVVTEQIFVIPGFGKLTLDSVLERDFAQVQAVVLVVTAGYVLVNLLVDFLYSVLNPRIRIAGRA